MSKLYLAGPRIKQLKRQKNEIVPAVIEQGKVRRGLFSYFYDGFQRNNRPSEDIIGFHENGCDVFLDSGAFTAFSKKIEIPLAKYADFCKTHYERFTVISSLDAIGSGEAAAQASYDNFCALKDLGVGDKLKPVWHVREPEHWLEKYLEEGHEYIFIGGMVPETNSWLLERLDDVFRRILTDDEGRPRAKYHGFGVTAWSLLFRYPWYSVDSTAYLIRAAYGMVVAPMGDRFVDITVSKDSPRKFDKNSWHVRNLTPPQRQYIEEWLATHDTTIEEVEVNGQLRQIINAVTYQSMEDRIPARFEKSVAMTLFG